MGRIIAIANEKGGVGKTTLTAHLGAALAEQDQQVLLIDFDPQACLTLSLATEALPESNKSKQEASSAKTVLPGIDLLPLSTHLNLPAWIQKQPQPQFALRTLLDKLTPDYDFILIDCPPEAGLLTTNALTASTDAIVPVPAEFLAIQGLRRMLALIDAVKQRWNPSLCLLGIVVSLYDPRTTLSQEVVETLRHRFGDGVCQTVIRYSAWAKRAPASQQTVLQLAPRSGIAEDFRQLAREVIARVKAQKGN